MELEEARSHFASFVAAFYRAAGLDEPSFECDAHAPVAFEAHVDGVKFSVGYDPLGAQPCLFAYCVLGMVPAAMEAQILRHVLENSVTLARQHGAAYCFDGLTQELGCYMRKSLSMDVGVFQTELAQLAQRVHAWRRDAFSGDDAREGAPPAAGNASAWPMFA